MDPVAWLDPLALLTVTPLGVLLVLIIRTRPGVRRRSLGRYARRVGLGVPPELWASIERRVAKRALAMELGSLAGLGVVTAWAALTQPPVADEPLWALALVGAVGTGGAVGSGLSAARRAIHRPDPRAPRIARPRQVALSDLVAPLELHGARVWALLPALILVAAGLTAALSDAVAVEGVLAVGPIAAAVLPLAVVTGSELAARRLLEQPQPAGSTLELAWNDALRSQVLRDLYSAPFVVGAYGTFGMLVGLANAARHAAVENLLGVTLGVLVLAALGMAVSGSISRPYRHFRRQLWPDLDTSPAIGGDR